MGAIKRFMKLESAGGIVLVAAAALAMIVANSPFAQAYTSALDMRIEVLFGGVGLSKPMILWINDLLMAIFFLIVGLELKKELLVGELKSRKQVMLPLAAALGGVVAPACIYAAMNWEAAKTNMAGWAIPCATDIAFAVGVLAMLGSRVSRGLKTFLLSLAVFDDLVAILIIAFFYTAKLNFVALGFAALGITALAIMNQRRVTSIAPYMLVGFFLWFCILKSGVHATIAGVVTGLFVPLAVPAGAAAHGHDHGHGHSHGHSANERLQHGLHPWVAFAILPLFAFANAGVSLAGTSMSTLFDPIAAGIAGGLVFGKPIGIMAAVGLMVALGFSKLPTGSNWRSMFGISVVAGIGFTMSLFIGNLAFKEHWDVKGVYVRLGVLSASVIAAFLGYFLLKASLPRTAQAPTVALPEAVPAAIPAEVPAAAPVAVRPSVRAPAPDRAPTEGPEVVQR